MLSSVELRCSHYPNLFSHLATVATDIWKLGSELLIKPTTDLEALASVIMDMFDLDDMDIMDFDEPAVMACPRVSMV
jgi:hypothetical protein